ncbi:MAG: hypothetical protein OXG43_06855 [Chloroflexi bacterium]|nr:hypothetical protein [Chloroflexota bacterium]
MGSRKKVLVGTAVLTAAAVGTLLGIWLWLLVSPILPSAETVSIPSGTVTIQQSGVTASGFAEGVAAMLVGAIYVSAVAAILWFLLALAWRAFVHLGHRHREYERRHTGV